MEPMGVLRRIDELGRIVIPKGIRSRLKINEGDRVELILENDTELLLRKYSPMHEIKDNVKNMLIALEKELNIPVLLCNNEVFLFSSSLKYEYYIEKPISSKLFSLLNERKNVGLVNHNLSNINEPLNCMIYPLAKNSELIGGLIMIGINNVDDWQNRIMLLFRNILLSNM